MSWIRSVFPRQDELRLQVGESPSGDGATAWLFRVGGIRVALSRRRELVARESFNERVVEMPKRREEKEPQEPIGIVISGGQHEDPTPRLSAYVYSIEDETSGDHLDRLAA